LLLYYKGNSRRKFSFLSDEKSQNIYQHMAFNEGGGGGTISREGGEKEELRFRGLGRKSVMVFTWGKSLPFQGRERKRVDPAARTGSLFRSQGERKKRGGEGRKGVLY